MPSEGGKVGGPTRRTYGPWMDLVLPAQAAVTADTSGGDSGKATSADQALQRLLGVSEMDPRPVFLYFHYPHEDVEKLTPDGRVSKKQCLSVDEEQVARWCLLYRCYEIDMGRSDKKSAERLGAGPGTSFAIVNWKLDAVAKSGPISKPEGVIKFLQDGLKNSFPEIWKGVEERVAEQKTLLAEARKLAAKKDWKAAQERYDRIRTSETRIYEEWDDAVDEAGRVAEKVRQAESK